MGADSPWHGAEEGSFGMLWVHGLQRSVVTLPDSGSKGLRFVAEHSAVQELVLTQLPTFVSAKHLPLASHQSWWPGHQQKGLRAGSGAAPLQPFC